MPTLLVALAVVAASPTLAISSPVAVADQQEKQEAMFAQVWVNDVDTGLVVEFTQRGDDLLASGDDLREIGIDAVVGSAPVTLRSIAGLTYRIDQATQTVRIQVVTSAMGRVEIEPTTAQAEDLLPAWGGLLNYSLYGDDTGTGGATGELRLFGPTGTFSSSVFVRRGPDQGGMTVRRLDTRYVFESPQRLQRLIVGDFIAPDGSTDGAIRAGGIQLATDFTLQPDLMTAPMPHLSGDNGVPSTVDLYVNGVRRLTQDVGAGRFTVSGVPMVDGAGQVSLLVRDVLGRESVQQISFYGSRELLRAGLTASSVQAGLLRSNAYAQHDRYDAAFASGTARRGLNDWMTGEVRLALAAPVQVAGAGLTTKFGEFGIGSISGDLSHSDQGDGAQAGISLRRDARRMSMFLAAQKSFGRFETLASRNASLEGWRLQAGGSWQSPTLGAFSLSATALHADRVTTRILATSWSRQIGRRFSAFANVVETRAGRSGFLASLGLTIVLSPRSTASVQAGSDSQGASGSASWSRYGGADRGIDLRAGISAAPGQSSLLGGATLRGNAGQIGADVQVGEHGTAARAFASGAAVWLGGKPELTAAVGQSFVMVQTGLPNVAVTLENRPAGRTRSDGSLFLPNLPANAAAKIALDYDGIDLDHETAQADMVVRTHGVGGAIVHMPVHAVHAATIHIVSVDGKPVPLGSVVRRPDGREDVVGYDGVAYLTDVTDKVSAEVHDGDQRCLVNFSRAAHDPIVCYPF